MNTPRRISLFTVIVAGLLVLSGCNLTVGSTRFSLPGAEPLVPNDTLFNEQWNLVTIQMPDAWGLLNDPLVQRTANNGQGLAPVVVAVLDTQIDVDHPDLEANVLGEVFRSTELAVVSPDPDTNWEHHGTHVAGIIAAENNNQNGVAGVGLNLIEILPVTVLDERGKGSPASVLEGLLYAAGMNTDAPQRTADIMNLSLGIGSRLGEVFEEALADIHEAGIAVVASAGNQSTETRCAPVDYPARYPSVIAVGSVHGASLTSFEFSFYTACGTEIDLVAPGGVGAGDGRDFDMILSTKIESGSSLYLELAGTSQAAPHVAGVAALMRAVNSELTPQQIRHILRETAAPAPTTTGPERYGAGMLNAHAALAAALSEPYGPFAQNEFSVPPAGSGTEDPDDLSLRLSTRGNHTEPGRGARRFADEGPQGDELPRIIITLDRAWFRSTDHAAVEAELLDIAARHGLGTLRFAGNRFPSFEVTDAQAGSAELLLQLVDEAHIHDAIYDVPLQLAGRESGNAR